MAEFKDRFVLRSTEASRAAGTLSILAVLETLLSTIGMWFLVIYTDWPFLLLSSLVLAFLMLLRSPQSVAMGVERFERYQETEVDSKPKVVLTIFSFALSCTFAWFAAQYWLLPLSVYTLFWGHLILLWIALNIGISVAVMVAGMGSRVILTVAAVAATGSGLVGAAMGAGTVVIIGIGFSLGVYLRGMFVRFWATLNNLRYGLVAFPVNWRELVSVTDTFSPPELIPGLPKTNPLKFTNSWLALKKTNDTAERVWLVVILPIFFIPALIYRFYLKSTAWIYLPLLWLAFVPAIEQAEDGSLVWDKAKGCSKLDKLFLLSAWIGLVMFAFSVTNVTEFIRAALETKMDTTIFTPWLFFLSMDLTALRGWQGLLITSSAVTLWLYYWADSINTKIDRRNKFTPAQSTLWFMRKLTNFKTLLTMMWIAGTVFALFYHLYHHNGLPDLINTWLIGYWGEMKHISP